MLHFTKWPHIENLSNEIEKDSYLFNRAKQLKGPWCVLEKVDGTNIGLTITRNNHQLNTRNNIIEQQDFYNIHNTKYLLEPVITNIQKYLEDNNTYSITLFGEYYGTNILNRINYKVPYAYTFYAMGSYYNEYTDILYYSQELFREIMAECCLYEYVIPLLYINTFNKCITYPNNQPSKFNHDEQMEGVVITPWNCPPYIERDKYIFKNKNEKFLERITRKVEYKNLDISVCEDLHSIFMEYLTESRMYSVISKIGKPKSNKDFSKYASAFINDAYEEFYNDSRQDMKYILLDKNAVKFVKNCGSKPYNIFCKIIADFCKPCKYYSLTEGCLEGFLDYSHCLYDGPCN